MMKKIKVILTVLFFILVVVIIVGVVFIKTFDANRYKPQILAAAESALGRKIDFSSMDLSISLTKGVQAKVSNVVISEDPAFASSDFLTAQEAFLGIDILSFIFNKQISIGKAQVNAPQIRIIRAPDGRINVQTIGAAAQAAPSEAAAQDKPALPSAMALPVLLVDAFEITEGQVTFVDQTVQPPLNVALKQLGLGLNSFSFDAPFPFFIKGSVFGKEENFRIDGQAQVNPKNFEVTLGQVKGVSDLNKFALDEIRRLPVIPQEAPFPAMLEGKLTVNIKDLLVGPEGLKAVHADMKLGDGKVALKDVSSGMSIVASRINASLINFSLDAPFQWDVSAAYLNDSENIKVSGQALLDTVTPSVTLSGTRLDTQLGSFSLEELRRTVPALKDLPQPEKLAGRLKVDLKEARLSQKGLDKLRLDAALAEGEVAVKEIAPGVAMDLNQLKLDITDFSLQDTFAFKGEASYASDQVNIFFEGKGAYNLETQQISVREFDLNTDLKNLSLPRLKQSLAALKDASLPDSLQGLGSVQIDSLELGPAGLNALSGITQIKEGRVKLKELLAPLEQIQAKINLSKSTLTLPALSMRIGRGSVEAQGALDRYLTDQVYQVKLDLKTLEIFELIEQKDYPVKTHGLLNGALNVEGQGLDPAKIKESLKGKGQLELTEGKLTDINILKMVLDKLTFIPNLRQAVEAGLPERFKEKLQQKDTILTKVSVDLGLDQGGVFIQPLNVDADGFKFAGQGKVSLDTSFELNGSFIIPQDLSASMVKAVPGLQYLFDGQGQILFPLKVSGKGSKLVFAPDMKYVTQNALKNQGRQEFEKVMDKVFNRDQPAADSTPATNDGTSPPKPKEKAPEQILLEGVLDSLFKK